MTTVHQDTFPSKRFMRKHFGWNRPIAQRLDTGFFTSNKHTELRRVIELVVVIGPKHLMTAQDRHFKGIREITVFKNYKLLDTPGVSYCRELLNARITLDSMRADFEQDLYDELSAYVLHNQPYAKNWWEWFAADGSIGARFTADAANGGNEPTRSLNELFKT